MLKGLRKATRRWLPSAERRHQAGKHRRRAARFRSGRWQHDGSLAQRRYTSYEEYLAHQASKLDRIHDRRVAKEPDAETAFRKRFEECRPLRQARNVLCLGSRLGAEVKVLRELGHFAVGIDLNPGPDNPYVLYGDFHQLAFRRGSVDAVFTNALDHVFDLPRLIAEICRVLRPGGIFVADIVSGYAEGSLPGEYESTHWADVETLLEAIEGAGPLTRLEQRPVDGYGQRPWVQVVFEHQLQAASAAAQG
jgi:SAM-dependent methyltransferase